jgi:hypothetical protein
MSGADVFNDVFSTTRERYHVIGVKTKLPARIAHFGRGIKVNLVTTEIAVRTIQVGKLVLAITPLDLLWSGVILTPQYAAQIDLCATSLPLLTPM